MMSTDFNSAINSIISGYRQVSLSDIESRELLNRQDQKYIYSKELLPEIFRKLSRTYKILEIDDNRIFIYNNIYYDTENLLLYHLHHNGKMNRYKIRRRTYKDTNTSYFEIKYKTNKNRTIKKRIPYDNSSTINKSAKNLLKENIDIEPNSLKAKLMIDYSRITLMHNTLPEKVTFDFNLHFNNNIHNASLNELVISEIKQNKYFSGISFSASEFQQLMHDLKIRPLTISKYCTGSLLTNPGLKHNRFKSKMMTINKICREYNNGS